MMYKYVASNAHNQSNIVFLYCVVFEEKKKKNRKIGQFVKSANEFSTNPSHWMLKIVATIFCFQRNCSVLEFVIV